MSGMKVAVQRFVGAEMEDDMGDSHDDLVCQACLMECENEEIKTRRRTLQEIQRQDRVGFRDALEIQRNESSPNADLTGKASRRKRLQMSKEVKPASGCTGPSSCSAPLAGNWRHGAGVLCCGTLRIAAEDFDTDPSPEFRRKIMDWICATLNAAQNAANQARSEAE